MEAKRIDCGYGVQIWYPRYETVKVFAAMLTSESVAIARADGRNCGDPMRNLNPPERYRRGLHASDPGNPIFLRLDSDI